MRRRVIRFYRDDTGEHRWTLHAANGRAIGAASEGYTKRANAERNALAVLGGESLRRLGDNDHGTVHGTMPGRDDVRVEWVL